MKLRAGQERRFRLRGAMRLAQMLELPEADLGRKLREIEADPLFAKMLAARVIVIAPVPQARLGLCGLGTGAAAPGPGLPTGVGPIELALIERVGRERFEACFLRDEVLSDAERAAQAGVSEEEARLLRQLVDRLTMMEEFEAQVPAAAPAKAFSVVAGVSLEGGRPVLSFFHRDVWRNRYAIDPERRKRFLVSVTEDEARRAEALWEDLALTERRKSTLFRVLDALLREQAAFLESGDPARRRPLEQRALALALDISPSVLNRLISDKAVELPSGAKAPLRDFFPSRKTVLRERVRDLVDTNPDCSDRTLGTMLAARYGIRLSRRSVAQYRLDAGIHRRGRRVARGARDMLRPLVSI